MALALFTLLPLTAEAGGVHTVRPGETLWGIAQQNNTTVAALAKENNIRNYNIIYAGQSLRIPASTHTVQRGDTLWLLAQRYKTTVAALASLNNISNASHIEVGQVIKLSGSSASVPVFRSNPSYSAAELDLFARLVFSEAAGEPFVGQVAVAASVLNRVASSIYPNTVTSVIRQVVNGYYQYSPVLDGRINLPANDTARRAVQEAINGSDPSLGATGFYNPRKTTNQWVRSQPVTTTIGNHVFFR